MSLPEPIEPQDDEPSVSPKPAEDARADWLCGPEEGLAAEMDRRAQESRIMQAPPLLRAVPPPVTHEPDLSVQAPIGLPLPPSPPAANPRRFGAVTSDSEGSDFQSGPAMMWEPGANSVPAVRRPAPRAVPVPEPRRDFPMDDAEERARVSAEAFAAAVQAAELSGRPHEVVAPESFNVTVVPMPWWMQVQHALNTDRRLQVLVGCVAVVLLTIAFWPRGEQPQTLGNLRRHPEQFDGHSVKVGGRVGEIFPVGGGYAFYLHQGRDTLVVFTRSRTPRRGENVTLVGSMSTGFLDGQPHAALFESQVP